MIRQLLAYLSYNVPRSSFGFEATVTGSEKGILTCEIGDCEAEIGPFQNALSLTCDRGFRI
jgi:hypothetical protein